jgi:hypothetical protein
MGKMPEGGDPMPPYDFVSRRDYEAQRDQRLLLDALPQDEEVVMRYSGRDKDPDFYAADYIVCIRGISRARRISEVHFEPVALDGRAAARAIGHVKVDNDSFVVSVRSFMLFDKIKAERGYFIGGPEIFNVTPEDIISQADPVEGQVSAPGSRLL